MKLKFTCLLIILGIAVSSFAQLKKPILPSQNTTSKWNVNNMPKLKKKVGVPSSPSAFNGIKANYQSIQNFQAPERTKFDLKVVQRSASGLPIMIKGLLPKSVETRSSSMDVKAQQYLAKASKVLQIENSEAEFKMLSQHQDEFGESHIKMQQTYKGIEVFGSELLLHTKKQRIHLLNGRHYPTPLIENIIPSLSANAAMDKAQTLISEQATFRPFSESDKKLVQGKEQRQAKLVIYHKEQDAEKESLAWEVTIYASPITKWIYLLDAHDGSILLSYSPICKIHGCLHEHKKDHKAINTVTNSSAAKVTAKKSTAFAGEAAVVTSPDLFGIDRELNVWLDTDGFGNQSYYMIDASRPQYDDSRSNLPETGTGVIATLDAQNKRPSTFSGYATIDVSYRSETDNNWSPAAVSAHYNSSLVFEYFKNTFGRNAIDGSGGNMLSIVNVVDDDGSSMENAFFSDGSMYYGNGGSAFDPLAKSLDVAGHEITHGVIQYTANLVYLSQSGALNESFADIFGAMIDRDDWQVGEDITNPQFIASGALRDLSNPNNGVSKGQNGWQPAHMDEYVQLPETKEGDNGGVHINSGITNKAFHLFATSIGRAKAEKVYYKALEDYLTRSSQFIDCRLAVIQAATDLHGANSTEATAAANAFDGVGIFGDGTGTTTPNDYQEDVEINPGEDFVLLTDEGKTQVLLANLDETDVPSISATDMLSKISITDDGSFAVFISADKILKGIEFDWTTSPVTYEEYDVSDETIWRNVAVSKDGNRLAALTDDQDNLVWIYDFDKAEFQTYELENPSTVQGISTSNVQYADVLEWDFTGEFVLYDALNKITRENSTDLQYWDIGFLRAWDNASNNFGDGFILKLIPELAENTSIGNPTFAKNSPYILAFDFLDEDDQNFVLGTNTETGDVGTIFQNSVTGYPNFSRLDDKMIFDAQNTADEQVLAVIELEDDKINGKDATVDILISGGKWGVWFAPGERELVSSAKEQELTNKIDIYPNPFDEELLIEIENLANNNFTLRLFNLVGQELLQQTITDSITSLSANNLPAGSYILQISDGTKVSSRKVVKF